jgi:hypothetical protein
MLVPTRPPRARRYPGVRFFWGSEPNPDVFKVADASDPRLEEVVAPKPKPPRKRHRTA